MEYKNDEEEFDTDLMDQLSEALTDILPENTSFVLMFGVPDETGINFITSDHHTKGLAATVRSVADVIEQNAQNDVERN